MSGSCALEKKQWITGKKPKLLFLKARDSKTTSLQRVTDNKDSSSLPVLGMRKIYWSLTCKELTLHFKSTEKKSNYILPTTDGRGKTA